MLTGATQAHWRVDTPLQPDCLFKVLRRPLMLKLEELGFTVPKSGDHGGYQRVQAIVTFEAERPKSV